jgi:acyl-CoA thioester hydrolase
MQQRPFETELHFHVKSYDVDYVGYVHNTVHIRWLEDLRVAMLAPHYSLEQCVKDGISPIITKTCIEYKRPLKLFDHVIGRVWVSKFEGVRWQVDHELVCRDALVATAEQSGIFISLQTHKPVPVPQVLAKIFLACQQSPAAQQ